LSQEKQDTGSLTGDNRRENEGRRGRGWAFFVVPGLVLCTAAAGYGMMKGFAGQEEEGPAQPLHVQAPLPKMPSDSFDPKTQAVQPATAVPPQLAEALAELEAQKQQIAQQQSQPANQYQGAQAAPPKPKRVRVISVVENIARPPDSGGAGSGTQGEMDPSSETGGDARVLLL
jgi:hypothetical protein